MSFNIQKINASHKKRWNKKVPDVNGGTIFHRYDFLKYHGEKFEDNESSVGIFKGETLFSAIPLGNFTEKNMKVGKSPYGGSYGGPVFEQIKSYKESRKIVEVLIEYLENCDYDRVEFTFPPDFCYETYTETFRFALLEIGFELTNRDVESVINLNTDVWDNFSSSCRNKVRKADDIGLKIEQDGSLVDFWKVLEKTFEQHDGDPTHTFEEFKTLNKWFPKQVYADVAYYDGKPVAAIGYLNPTEKVVSSFYLCHNPEYRDTAASNYIIYRSLINAKEENKNWYNFGTSSYQMKARPEIFTFKESFGAIGRFRETMSWVANSGTS